MAYDLEGKGVAAPVAPSAVTDGGDLNRVLALTDGVFAFSLTLLVVYLAVPTTTTLAAAGAGQGMNAQLEQYLLNQRTAFFAYGVAFFIVGTWWSAHRRLFDLLARQDRRLVTLNLLFLVFIAVTPFDVGLLANYGGSAVAVGFYGGTQALAGFSLLAMWVYTARRERRLLRTTVDPTAMNLGTRLATIAPLGFAVSVPVAVVSPLAAIAVWFAVLALRVVLVRRLGVRPPAGR